MSWLRLDDSFDRNPKILALGSDDKRWTWTRVLLYAANARSPIVPDNIKEIVPKANKAFIDSCVNAKLLDVTEDGLLVHDWSKYQPRDATNADRQAKFRNAKVTDQTVTVTDQSNGEVSNGCSRARVPVQSSPNESSNEDSAEPVADAPSPQKDKRPGRKRKEPEYPAEVREDINAALTALFGAPVTGGEFSRRGDTINKFAAINADGAEILRRGKAMADSVGGPQYFTVGTLLNDWTRAGQFADNAFPWQDVDAKPLPPWALDDRLSPEVRAALAVKRSLPAVEKAWFFSEGTSDEQRLAWVETLS